MPDLPEVTQRFVADTAPYITNVEAAARAARDLAAANAEALAMIRALQEAMGGATGSALALTSAERDLSSAMRDKTAEVIFQESSIADLRAEMGLLFLASHILALSESDLGRQLALTAGITALAVRETGDLALSSAVAGRALQLQQGALASTGRDLMLAGSAAGQFGRAEYDLVAVMAEKTGAAARQGSELGSLAGHMALAAGAASTLAGEEAKAAASMAAAGGGARGGMIAQWFAQWSQVLHWVVMGSLEIAATAIPAMVAFGAAAAAMTPTFTHIADQMNYLRTATGSWSGVMAASVGPLQAAGAASVRLRQSVAPDAYIIFGAAINALTGHVGAFSSMARQASNALAGFATKLSADLSGPAGQQIAGFFANAVKYMVQWGQVLGNLGHGFINVVTGMKGVGQLLLDVLDRLSLAFEQITAIPLVANLIGIAAAMSALYRYSILLKNIFVWLGGTALINVAKYLIAAGVAAAGTAVEFGLLAGAGALLDAVLTPLIILLTGPVGIALALVAAGLGVWYLSAHEAKTSTDQLIASINKMTPTLANTSQNMQKMEGNLLHLRDAQAQLDKAYVSSAGVVNRFGIAQEDAALGAQANVRQIQQSIAEIRKLAEEGVNLATGMAEAGIRSGQLGAFLQLQAIQTAIADSKIQQLNQAIDQYIGMLTSATSGNANFITSMSNLGSVNATVSNNLGTSTVTLTLNARKFGDALSHMGTVGAAAWQNFDQVLTGSMGPMMDNLRMLGVTGALTGKQVSTAAMDMAVQLGRYAGTNKTAQAEVMGFLRAQGLTFPSFRKFMEDAKQAGAGQHQLNGIMNQGTRAFANLSQMAKNAASAMNPIVANAIDAAALKGSGFNGALAKMQTDMSNTHTPATVIQADMQAVQRDYQGALSMAERTGSGISDNAQKSSRSTREATSQMSSAWGRAKGKQMELASQVQSSSANIGSHSNGAAGQVHAAMSSMATSFDIAKQHAQWLQAEINSMHGTSITVQTNFVTTGNPNPGSRSSVLGGQHGMTVGFQGGGIVGGAGGLDAIHAMLTAGEAVLTARAVSALGGPLAIHTLNNQPSQAVLTTGAGGGGGGALTVNQHVDVMMDGSKIGSAWRSDLMVYNRRNPSANTSLRVR